MSLSDADLRDLVRTIDEAGCLFTATQDEVKEAVDELRALRARVVGGTDGPGQGDPAAHPPYLWAWRISHLTWSGTVDVETATAMAAEYGQAPVSLYRAPGAVAAAPPGDEDATDDLRAVLNALYSDGEREAATPARARFMRHLATGGAVRLVPPAGHEDEAAVERAARDEVENRHHIHGEWCLCGFRSAVARDRTVHILDALAAARGPRTPRSDR